MSVGYGQPCADLHVLYVHNHVIRHLLDPMHVLKSVSMLLMDYMLGFKDNVAARKDLEASRTKPDWWVREGQPVQRRGRRGRRRGRSQGQADGSVRSNNKEAKAKQMDL